MNNLKLKKILEQFLLEDVGDRDLTSQAIFPMEQKGKGIFIAKEAGIIAGLDVIELGYGLLSSALQVTLQVKDGDTVEKGQVIAEVHGPVQVILTGERVILNLLQRMSGIATLTNKSVSVLNDSSIQICDTRKTTPGLRMLEKYAVRVGGGKNHRYGLYDGVMIKDNHIAYCGSISKAVEKVRQSIGHMVKIEVEVENKSQVLEAVEAGAHVIMFDNCSPEEVKEFGQLVPDSIVTEASGGIDLEKLPLYAGTRVHYISLGALTHSARALDISLNVKERD